MDWSWILWILKTDGRSIDIGRYATSFTEFLRRIKRSYVRPNQVFSQKYIKFLCIQTLCVDTHTHSNVAFSIIIFQLSYIIIFLSFFLNRLRPKTVGRADWHGGWCSPNIAVTLCCVFFYFWPVEQNLLVIDFSVMVVHVFKCLTFS